MEGPTKLSAFADEPSVAIVISWITPAVAAAGDAMPNCFTFDLVPDEESWTAMLAVPGSAIREFGMDAVRMALVPNVVDTGAPFHWTTEEVVNPVPFTRKLKPPPPATM
jgi:hypothetical protein